MKADRQESSLGAFTVWSRVTPHSVGMQLEEYCSMSYRKMLFLKYGDDGLDLRSAFVLALAECEV